QFGRHCDRSSLRHRRMLAAHAIELGARNVLTTPTDDVFLARYEKEIAIRVAPHELAGQKPAVAKSAACLLFVAEISLHDDRRLNHQLTRDIYIDIVAFIVDNAALRPRPVSIGMPSCGAHAAKLLRTVQRTARDARNLRHAIAA